MLPFDTFVKESIYTSFQYSELFNIFVAWSEYWRAYTINADFDLDKFAWFSPLDECKNPPIKKAKLTLLVGGWGWGWPQKNWPPVRVPLLEIFAQF